MRMLRNLVVVLIVCISSFHTVRGATASRNCQQYPTLAEALANDTELTVANEISKDSKATTILNSPLVGLTLIAPIDAAARKDLDAFGGTVSPLYNDLAAHFFTLLGDYSLENVTSVPSINTDLGFVTRTDTYSMKFYTNETNGKLYVRGLPEYAPSEVLDVIEACNGVIYKLATVLQLANNTEADLLTKPEFKGLTPGTVDERIIEAYFGQSDDYACAPSTFVSRGNPYAQNWLDIWNATGLLTRIRGTSSTFTVFVPPPTADPEISLSTALYNMVPGLWCSDELINAGSKNSMLGAIENRDLPLKFSNDSNGNLIVTGANGAATVLSQSVWCSSIMYQTDQILLPPAQITSISLPGALPTLPIRHINCSAQNQVNIASYSSSSDNTGLIIGLSVGLGCAAILAAAGGYLLYRKRRKQQQISTKQNVSVVGSGTTSSGAADKTDSSMEPEIDVGSHGTVPVLQALGWLNSGEHYTARAGEDVIAGGQVKTTSSPGATTEFGMSKTGQLMNQLSRLASANSNSDIGIDLWNIDPKDVEIDIGPDGKPIRLGSGAFGVTYSGLLRGVQRAAMKVLKGHQEDDFLKEVAILKHVNRDKNVVQLYGSCRLSEDQLLIVMELMEGGDLRKNLDKPNAAETMAWTKNGKRIALDVARGLTALHANNIVHRDLKSKNILLTQTMQAKIADVGLAAVHSQGYLSSGAGRVVGTLAWCAPEVLLGRKCSEKVDIYSFGIVLYEIATRLVPRRGMLELPNPCEECPAELIALIFDCIKETPKLRPSAKEVCDRLLKMPPLLYPDV